jgi:hypothetical protein
MNVIPFVAFIGRIALETVTPRKTSQAAAWQRTQREWDGYGYVENEQDWLGSAIALGDACGVRHRCIGSYWQ